MNYVRFLVLASLLVSLSFAHAGSVRSMSANVLVGDADGQTYFESSVKCSKSKLVVIRREEKGSRWCAKDVDGFCQRSKIQAAAKVCGGGYSRALKAKLAAAPDVVEEEPVAEPIKAAVELEPAIELVEQEELADEVEQKVASEPVAELAVDVVAEQDNANIQRQNAQLAIEERRLKLQQQKLELRKQELALQKQELDLKRELDGDKKVEPVQAKKVEPKPAPIVKKVQPKKVRSSVPLLFRTPATAE